MGLLYSPAGRAAAGMSRETQRIPSTLDDDRPRIRLTQIGVGNPIWKPVDLHLFSAPIGFPFDEALFLNTALALVNPQGTQHHKFHPDLFVGPGEPHRPPYDREFRNGVARLGLDERDTFTVSDFSGANAIWLVGMAVPNPGTQGSSPDFAFPPGGPIIPNSIFPIKGPGTTTRNGAPFGPTIEFIAPPLDNTLMPPFSVDGHSHFPMFYVDAMVSADAGTDPVGSYTYRLMIRDQNGLGAGWQIEVDFVVSCTGDDDDGDDD